MERLSTTIQKLYQTYAPELARKKVSFNLDFPDTTLKIPKDSMVPKLLRKELAAAAKRTLKGSIDLTVKSDKIILKDTGTPLAKSAIEKLNAENISAKSRVGFGNEIVIPLDSGRETL